MIGCGGNEDEEASLYNLALQRLGRNGLTGRGLWEKEFSLLMYG